MSSSKGFKFCMEVFRKLGYKELPAGMPKVRFYWTDWPNDWQLARAYEDVGFDPRVDARRTKMDDNQRAIKDIQNAIREIESRRRVPEDTVDHQRRQARIIDENRRKWENRAEPKPPLPHDQMFGSNRKNRSQRWKSDEDKIAEKYSRKRRQLYQQEKERQDRELREYRKDYKLPRAETTDSAARNALMERKIKQDDNQYWHSWTTCPEERGVKKQREQAVKDQLGSDEVSNSYKPNDRRGFMKPTLPYDRTVRRFQTDASQLRETIAYSVAELSEAVKELRDYEQNYQHLQYEKPAAGLPSGMDKQFGLAQYIRKSRQASMMESHWPSPRSDDEKRDEQVKKTGIEQPSTKLARFVSTQLDIINRAIAQKNQRQGNSIEGVKPPLSHMKVAQENQRQDNSIEGVKPPLSHMTVAQENQRQGNSIKGVKRPLSDMTIQSNNAKLKRPPIEGFSSVLAADTRLTPPNEYTGYFRQSIVDTWKNFEQHRFKPE